MQTINIHEAKTHLSKILEQVSAGEEIIITKAGTPIARVVPYLTDIKKRQFGKDKGLFTTPDDFDAELPKTTLKEYEQI